MLLQQILLLKEENLCIGYEQLIDWKGVSGAKKVSTEST